MSILDKLSNKEMFTSTELAITNFIIYNPKLVSHMTIDALADATYTSKASIVRFCRKLGIKGYSELKIQLASEVNTFNVIGERIPEDIPFKKGELYADSITKLLNLNYQALTDAFSNLDLEKVQRMAKIILNYNNLNIFGIGQSYLIAADFHYKMLRIGMNVHLESMPGFTQLMDRRGVSEKDKSIALFVSYYGAQREHLRMASIFQQLHIPILLITGPKNNPMCKYATEIIHVNVREPLIKIGAFSSKTAMQFVLDSIYTAIFLSNYDQCVKIINQPNTLDYMSLLENDKE